MSSQLLIDKHCDRLLYTTVFNVPDGHIHTYRLELEPRGKSSELAGVNETYGAGTLNSNQSQCLSNSWQRTVHD